MAKDRHSEYSAAIKERIDLIMTYSGLTIKGLEEFTKVSESHIYALRNGNKRIADETAKKFASAFHLRKSQLLNLDYEIPENIKKLSSLLKFKKDFSENDEYFNETKNDKKKSYYIEFEFLNSPIFNERVYVWEILEKLKQKGKFYKSKELSQILHYLVIKKKLMNEKRPLKLKKGGLGNRLVDVFFKIQ